MTIVHPPSTDRETNAVEHLDYAPPCEYSESDCSTLAVWAALLSPCRCETAPTVVIFCDPCWSFRNSAEEVYCPACGDTAPTWETVLRVERI